MPQKIPKILTEEEINSIFLIVKNPKHRLMIALMYGCGLTSPEVSCLHSIKVLGKELKVRSVKGIVLRTVPFPRKMNVLYWDYLTTTNAKSLKPYLFPGADNGHITNFNINKIIRLIGVRCGINRPVTPLLIRQSYIVAMLQSGVHRHVVMRLTGIKARTSMLPYSSLCVPQVLKIKSPLESINFN